MSEFRMPSLGADMEAGTLVEWRVAPGDVVHRGDIVALVDTDKATIEVEIWEDGVVETLLVAPGVQVPVGTPLARLRPVGEVASAPAGEAAAAAPARTGEPPAPATPAPGRAEAPAPEEGPARAAPASPSEPRREAAAPVGAPAWETPPSPPRPVRATPLARRIARMRGIDLGRVQGSGPSGAIVRADVETAVPEARPGALTAAPAARGPLTAARPEAASERTLKLRRAMAAAMARSKREIPHYYLGGRIDLSRALAWLAAENVRRPITERILPAALLLRAVALAAREVPELNGSFVDGFHPASAVHLGVAVSLRDGGLVAPALHDADRKGVDAIMRDLTDLVRRTRAGILRSSELTDATLTVTNLGEQGVESVYGVIYPPQVALVGFGRIADQPWAQDGMLGVRPVVGVSLAADHRVSDGHRGARFLAAVDHWLQKPEKL